jgi:hypothetical protein
MAIPTPDGIIGQREGAMSKQRIEQTDLRRPWPAVHPRRFRIHRAHQFCGGPRRRRCSPVPRARRAEKRFRGVGCPGRRSPDLCPPKEHPARKRQQGLGGAGRCCVPARVALRAYLGECQDFQIELAGASSGCEVTARAQEVLESGEPVCVDVDVAQLVLIGLH